MGKANQYCCYSLGQLYQCSALLPDCEASHCLEHVSAAMATAEQLQSLTATGTTRYVWRLSSGSFRCPGGGSSLQIYGSRLLTQHLEDTRDHGPKIYFKVL